MSRVFITQEMHGRNFLPARHFGQLVAVLPDNAQVVISARPVLRKIQRTLSDYSGEDYLLLSGDPIIMGLCMMVASEKTNGRTFKGGKVNKSITANAGNLPKTGD